MPISTPQAWLIASASAVCSACVDRAWTHSESVNPCRKGSRDHRDFLGAQQHLAPVSGGGLVRFDAPKARVLIAQVAEASDQQPLERQLPAAIHLALAFIGPRRQVRLIFRILRGAVERPLGQPLERQAPRHHGFEGKRHDTYLAAADRVADLGHDLRPAARALFLHRLGREVELDHQARVK
jgi:hypothetical protein